MKIPSKNPTVWKRIKCWFTGGHNPGYAEGAVGGRNIQYCTKCDRLVSEHPVGREQAKIDRYWKRGL